MDYHQFDAESKQSSESLYYFFFNTSSGSVKARQLSRLDCQEQVLIVNEKEVRVKFYNINSVQSRDRGYADLKLDLIRYWQIHVVIGGGDGSMMWVVEQLQQKSIDLSLVIIIPMPLGTGNDFSNALGWGVDVPNDILGTDFSILKNYIMRWQRGHQCYFDVWDITVRTQNGSFTEVIRTEDGYLKQQLKENDQIQTTLTKRMSNYFSIGVDARIGYGFDKRRTSNKHCNKCWYCLEGFQKIFIKTPRVKEVIHSAYNSNNELLFENDKVITIRGDPCTMVCLNINSYSAGTKDIWLNAKPLPDSKHQENTSFSDGLLEFFSFESIIGIGGERIISGNATRLAQTSCPMTIKFKETDIQTYFQIDGQYFQVTNPVSAEIVPARGLKNGKIRVLYTQ